MRRVRHSSTSSVASAALECDESTELVLKCDTTLIWGKPKNRFIKSLIIYYIFILVFKNIIYSFWTYIKGGELETTKFDIN